MPCSSHSSQVSACTKDPSRSLKRMLGARETCCSGLSGKVGQWETHEKWRKRKQLGFDFLLGFIFFRTGCKYIQSWGVNKWVECLPFHTQTTKFNLQHHQSWAQWHRPVIIALRRQRQGEHGNPQLHTEFEASLGYVRLWIKKNAKGKGDTLILSEALI